jgi:endo-1,4-beta-xylanase
MQRFLILLMVGCGGSSDPTPVEPDWNGESGSTGGAEAVPAMDPPEVDGEVTSDLSGPQDPAYNTTLRAEAAKRGMLIGAALNDHALGWPSPTYRNVAAREFDYATPETQMKWAHTEPNPGQFTWAEGERLLQFCEANGIKVKGHNLVWHVKLPGWVSGLQGPELRKAMARHIETVVGHWKGRIDSWDVVNEAISDGGGLRPSPFLDELGPGYIAEAYRLAHEADPSALLFYNDYGIEGMNGKSNEAYHLMQKLLAEGVPIDGIGLQMHITTLNHPSMASIAANIQRLKALGLQVNISELDMPLDGAPLRQQRNVYHNLFKTCLDNGCYAVTTWGVYDGLTWLGGGSPLLFSASFMKKPAYFGVLDALLGR